MVIISFSFKSSMCWNSKRTKQLQQVPCPAHHNPSIPFKRGKYYTAPEIQLPLIVSGQRNPGRWVLCQAAFCFCTKWIWDAAFVFCPNWAKDGKKLRLLCSEIRKLSTSVINGSPHIWWSEDTRAWGTMKPPHYLATLFPSLHSPTLLKRTS